MGAMELVEQASLTTDRPRMKSGDTVRVHVKVREGDKERIQIFEGIVIGLHRGGARASFTVRKVSFGQGVERIFPLHSPTIAKVDVVRSARVRRAKLYYLRDLKGKTVTAMAYADSGYFALLGMLAGAGLSKADVDAQAAGPLGTWQLFASRKADAMAAIEAVGGAGRRAGRDTNRRGYHNRGRCFGLAYQTCRQSGNCPSYETPPPNQMRNGAVIFGIFANHQTPVLGLTS